MTFLETRSSLDTRTNAGVLCVGGRSSSRRGGVFSSGQAAHAARSILWIRSAASISLASNMNQLDLSAPIGTYSRLKKLTHESRTPPSKELSSACSSLPSGLDVNREGLMSMGRSYAIGSAHD